MRTAKEIYEFCKRNDYGTGSSKGWSIKHCSIIEKHLQPDENIQLAFIAIHNYQSLTKHDGNFAYAITDRRMLLGQKKFVGEVFQIIPLDKINHVGMVAKYGVSLIVFDSFGGAFNVFVNQKSAANILEQINKVLFASKATITAPTSSTSVADEIRQLKSLLDDGILTQDEFDAKKKRLLGL